MHGTILAWNEHLGEASAAGVVVSSGVLHELRGGVEAHRQAVQEGAV